MRLFVEAVLEPEALDAVWTVGERLREQPAFPEGAVRWVKREAMHLTLRFLGEVDEERVEDVCDRLATLQGCGGFELRFVDVGTFGGRTPRVVWVGLARDEGFDRLQTLRQRLDQELVEVGFEMDDGPFRPHLTLGRVRRQASRSELAAIRSAVLGAAPREIRSAVERVALVESTLLKDGPRYRRLKITEL